MPFITTYTEQQDVTEMITLFYYKQKHNCQRIHIYFTLTPTELTAEI
jgi:hypothetical protein